MPGAIERANSESIAELKELLARVGQAYAKPTIKLLASMVGVPEPLQDVFLSTIKNCADAYRRNDSEEAEFRAKTAINMAALYTESPDRFKSVTPERLRSLYQRLTRKAVNARVDETVSVVVAATLGGSDEFIASPADLHLAEWLEELRDSQLMHVRNVCAEIFPFEVIDPYVRVPDNHRQAPAIFLTPPTSKAVDAWRDSAPGWPNFSRDLFAPASGLVYCADAKMLWAHSAPEGGEFWSDGRRWERISFCPTEKLQRTHNAFVRAKQAAAYEMKLYNETV